MTEKLEKNFNFHDKKQFVNCPYLTLKLEEIQHQKNYNDMKVVKLEALSINYCLQTVIYNPNGDEDDCYYDIWELPDLISCFLESFFESGKYNKAWEIKKALDCR